jgi:hypothetical protein
VRFNARQSVAWVEFSGVALETLRAGELFVEVLHLLGSTPHRVTRLDATLDRDVPSAGILADLYERSAAGEVSLTRKAAYPRKYLAPGLDGRDTGTIYLGKPTAKVRARVYDKQHERWQRAGEVQGPRTRWECTVRGDMGVSLRDAWDPAPVFWHYMAPDVLTAPDGVPAWEPAGEGYQLEQPAPRDPLNLLERRIESLDLDDLMAQAAAVPGGVELVLHAVRKRARAHGWEPASASAAKA